MDHRGQHFPDSGRQSQRTKNREDYSRYFHQDRDQSYPSPDPRERDRHWAHPDPHYGANFTSSPARMERYPYNYHQYSYGYGRPDQQRPQSRHGYDYPPHSHWDYRDSYGYYDQDYYRGQYGQQDPGQWNPQDPWRTDYHERQYRPEHPGSFHSEENRDDQGKDISQPYLSDFEEIPSRENEEVSSYHLGTLESSKISGLSSSSFELSQYINGDEHREPVPQPGAGHGAGLQTSAPLKYSVPHVVVSFGPAGQLIRVTPGFSIQKNISQLEIHSLEAILSETQEQQEMRDFPGPLTREDLHKVDAIEFAHQKAGICMRDSKLHDKSSGALLWNLLILLCRQNGQIVGSDIAELLMQSSHPNGSWESEAPTLIDFSEGTTAEAPPQKGEDLLTGNCSSFSSETSQKALQSYTQLLLAGRKKEALESAMSSGLWGHALFLASKMDSRSYTTVLSRFTGQLTASDPLQTLFQLLSGRIPTVATCCGNEKSGDWRPHLAVMLSNETGDPAVHQKAIITMGDTLASKGLIHAAHMCYLTAGVPFGLFTQKADRLVLLGSSHRQSFKDFATNSAIQCTELYEYCQTIGSKCFLISAFQVYKFLYACRLLDCGLASQAFHYCEVVGQAIVRQKEPFFVLTTEVIKLADRLRHSEGQFSEAGVSGAGQEPDWLKQLRARHHSFQMGNYDCTETDQPAPASASSGFDDRSCDIQSPEPELLYYGGIDDQENILHETERTTEQMTALSCDDGGAQDWLRSNPPIPATVVYAPSVPTAAQSQDLSYHNTDSVQVRSPTLHCPLSDLPSVAEEAASSSGTVMVVGGAGANPSSHWTAGQILGADIGQGGQDQQTVPPNVESSEQMNDSPKQSTKAGWFSGWFASKPKALQKESSEQRGPPQTAVPPTAGSQQPSSSGINPFSRKAGQQLG